MLFPAGIELGQSLPSYEHPAHCVARGMKFPSEAALPACIGEVSFWGVLEVQSYSEGALDETLREVLLHERSSNMAFPKGSLTQFLLGVLAHVLPPCHYAGAELS